MELSHSPVFENGFDATDSEKDDSDEEPEEEEESDGSCTQALVEHVETSFLDLLEGTILDIEQQQDVDQRVQIKSVKMVNMRESRDEETQTDNNMPNVVENSPAAVPEEGTRSEISSLRLARDTLINQRKEVSDRLKQGASVEVIVDEKKIYEFEEAIEAIDSAIEFKNEIICGREYILSNCLAPGRNEADLVSRLTTLSTLELQRLLWKYLSKVVELRHSSKRLEKQIEALEASNDKLTMMLSGSQRHIKDMQADYESRIKLILGMTGKYDANSGKLGDYIFNLDKKLSNALKKQYDFQRALTELLVRHGYLLNGTDYDVKQVVKMLGIDTVEMGLNWKPEEKSQKSKYSSGIIPPDIRSALESGIGSQGMSRRMREAYGNHGRRGQEESSGSARRAHPGHGIRDTNRYVPNYDLNTFPPAPPPAAVRREKQKLIIQQHRSNTPDNL